MSGSKAAAVRKATPERDWWTNGEKRVMDGLVSDRRWGCVTRRLRAKTVPADCEARWTLEMFK
jgi:hypothetical protein